MSSMSQLEILCVGIQMVLRKPSFGKHEFAGVTAKLKELAPEAPGFIERCSHQPAVNLEVQKRGPSMCSR